MEGLSVDIHEVMAGVEAGIPLYIVIAVLIAGYLIRHKLKRLSLVIVVKGIRLILRIRRNGGNGSSEKKGGGSPQ